MHTHASDLKLWFMQSKVSDQNAYYSCDDSFNHVDKASESGHRLGNSHDQSPKINDTVHSSIEARPNLEGIYLHFRYGTIFQNLFFVIEVASSFGENLWF